MTVLTARYQFCLPNIITFGETFFLLHPDAPRDGPPADGHDADAHAAAAQHDAGHGARHGWHGRPRHDDQRRRHGDDGAEWNDDAAGDAAAAYDGRDGHDGGPPPADAAAPYGQPAPATRVWDDRSGRSVYPYYLLSNFMLILDAFLFPIFVRF